MESNATQPVDGLKTERTTMASVAIQTFEGLEKEKATMASVGTETDEVRKTYIATMASDGTQTYENLKTEKATMASVATQTIEVLTTEKAIMVIDATQAAEGLKTDRATMASEATQTDDGLEKQKAIMASVATQAAEGLKTDKATMASEATQTDDGLEKQKAIMASVATQTSQVLKVKKLTRESDATQTVQVFETAKDTITIDANKTVEVLKTERSTSASDVFPTVEPLYNAQREVAFCLEQAYRSLADHPDVAKEIRMMAHSARSQHQMTSSLMKKFITIAALITKTMIPIIWDAVELQDRRLIIKVFSNIIKHAETMKKESADTQNSYLLLQMEVEKCMRSATERNNLIEVKRKRLKEELDKEEETDTVAALTKKTQEEENKRMEEDLKSLKERRTREFQAADEAGRASKRNFFGIHFLNMGNNERLKMAYQLEEEYCRKQKELCSGIERLNVLKEKENQQLQKKKELRNLQAGLCNVESLRQAIIHLKDVDGQFKKIIQLWEDTAATLRSWEVNVKEIEIMEYAEQLKKSTSSVKKHCEIFGTIFTNYVKESDYNIIGLYNFLSCSIYQTSDSDRTATQGALISSV